MMKTKTEESIQDSNNFRKRKRNLSAPSDKMDTASFEKHPDTISKAMKKNCISTERLFKQDKEEENKGQGSSVQAEESGKAARKTYFRVVARGEKNAIILDYAPGRLLKDKFRQMIQQASPKIRQQFRVLAPDGKKPKVLIALTKRYLSDHDLTTRYLTDDALILISSHVLKEIAKGKGGRPAAKNAYDPFLLYNRIAKYQKIMKRIYGNISDDESEDDSDDESEDEPEIHLGDCLLDIFHDSDAIKENPNDPILYSNRAASYLNIGSFALALEDCQSCLKLFPDFIRGHVQKAHALLGLDENDKAFDAVLKAMEIGVVDSLQILKIVLGMSSG